MMATHDTPGGLVPELSLAMADLATDQAPRERILAAAKLGYRALTLDAKAPGLRARELDRSARRDLAATFRRAELRLAGVDLWIPEEHFCDPTRIDRAIAAGVGTIDLVAELASLTLGDPIVNMVLPAAESGDARRAMAAAAEAAGVQIADHHWPLGETPAGPIGSGLDPVVALFEKADPVAFASSPSLISARLAGLGDAAIRVPLDAPSNRLDLLSYRAALSLAPMLRTLVVDVRGLTDAHAGAVAALDAWRDPLLG